MLSGQNYYHFRPNRMALDNIDKDQDWLYQPVVHVSYAQTVLRIAEERGLPRSLIRDVGLSETDLNDPIGLIAPMTYAWLAALIVERVGNHGLGFEVGLRLPPTAHGSLGYALVCSGTLRKVVTLLKRFWHIRERTLQFHFFEQDGWGVMHFYALTPYPETLRIVHFDCLMAIFYRAITLLLGSTEIHGELWLDYPEQDYYPQYRDQFPPIRYDMPASQLRFPTELLDRPLPMSNPAALQLAIAQCERESVLMGGQREDFMSSVFELIILSEGSYPTQEDLAAKLHTSVRTLRRRLQTHGTSYRELLESARQRDALNLLESTSLSIQTIAGLLGYLNPANFTRAFSGWMGQSPRDYRANRERS